MPWIIGALFCVLLLAQSGMAQEDYNVWNEHMPLVLNTSSSGANVTTNVMNFPVLVRLTSSNCGDVFQVAKAGGADIRFSKADYSQHFSYQIERWNATSQVAEIWVLVDTVYGGQSTQTIVMHYGNSGAANSSSGPAVFSSTNGFQAVWHLQDLTDATGNGNTLTATGTAPVKAGGGIIDSCYTFGGSGALKMAPGLLGNHDTLTLSGWASVTGTSAGAEQELVSMGNAAVISGFAGTTFTNVLWYSTSTTGTQPAYSSDSGISGKGWVFVSGVFNPVATTETYYQNGVVPSYLKASSTMPSSKAIAYNSSSASTTDTVALGYQPQGSSHYYLTGSLEEVRIENVARSASWINLSYQNQKQNQALVQTPSLSGITLISNGFGSVAMYGGSSNGVAPLKRTLDAEPWPGYTFSGWVVYSSSTGSSWNFGTLEQYGGDWIQSCSLWVASGSSPVQLVLEANFTSSTQPLVTPYPNMCGAGENMQVDGQVTLKGNLSANAAVTVGGATTLNSGLTVSGGASQLTSGLTVTGGTVSDTLGVKSGNLTVGTGNLTVSKGKLTVSAGAAQLGSGLAVTGGTVSDTLGVSTGNLTVGTGNLTVSKGKLTVSAGAAQLSSGLAVTGGTTSDSLTVGTGNLTVSKGKLTVSAGAAQLKSGLAVTGGTVSDTLGVSTGNLTVGTGNLTVSKGNLTVNGSTTVNGLTVLGSSNIGGTINLNSLNVSSGITCDSICSYSSLTDRGNANINGVITCSGLNSNSNVNVGNSNSQANLTVTNNITSSGTIYSASLNVAPWNGINDSLSQSYFYEPLWIESNEGISGPVLTVTGGIQCNGEIQCDSLMISNWTLKQAPDFVFAQDYRLPALDSVAAYIKVHSHLPEVPSAAEMKQNGVELGELNMTLLKKIEELTLYTIEMKNQLDAQAKEIETLRQEEKGQSVK
jgi:hypothetical protein